MCHHFCPKALPMIYCMVYYCLSLPMYYVPFNFKLNCSLRFKCNHTYIYQRLLFQELYLSLYSIPITCFIKSTCRSTRHSATTITCLYQHTYFYFLQERQISMALQFHDMFLSALTLLVEEEIGRVWVQSREGLYSQIGNQYNLKFKPSNLT